MAESSDKDTLAALKEELLNVSLLLERSEHTYSGKRLGANTPFLHFCTQQDIFQPRRFILILLCNSLDFGGVLE